MALVLADRVLETCSAPGTGAVSLLGAITGYQAFSAAVGNSNTCYYTIADQNGANWEVGVGTYSSSGNTLARTTVLASSNGGSLTNFSSGSQNVFLTYPAEKAVTTDNITSVVFPNATANGVAYFNGSKVLSSGTALTFDGTNFGVGSSAPGQKFVVNGVSGVAMQLENSSDSNRGGRLIVSGSSASGTFGVNTTSSGYTLTFGIDSVEQMRLTSTGLGIGTSSPSATLHVAGSSNTSGWSSQSYVSQFGVTTSSDTISLIQNASVYAQTGATAKQFYGSIHAPQISNDGTGGSASVSVSGIGVFPTIAASGSSAAIGSITGANINVARSNANDTSANVSNQWAIFAASQISGTVGATAFTGGLYGIQVSASFTGGAGATTMAGVYGSIGINLSATALSSTAAVTNSSCFYTGLTIAPATGKTVNITNLYGLNHRSFTIGGGAGTANVSNYYGIYLGTATIGSGATLTNNYGLYQADSAATNYFAGKVGIGTSSPSYKLDVRGVIAGGDGTIVGGISYSTRPEIGAISNHPVGFITNNTTQMLLDTSGNLGLGVTPSAWNTTVKAVEIGSLGTAITTNISNGNLNLRANAINTISGVTYGINGYAGTYSINPATGLHTWQIAPSGTAGNPITFTQAMTLDASGLLNVGTTGGSRILNLNGVDDSSSLISVKGTLSSAETILGVVSTGTGYVGTLSNSAFVFRTNNTERMRIDTSGNVGIGTSSPVNKLVVSNAGAAGAEIRLTHGDGTTVGASFLSYNRSGSAFLPLEISGSYLKFSISDTERMRLDSAGNLGLGVTPSAWGSNWRALQVGNFYTNIAGYLQGGGGSAIIHNAYNDNTNWLYQSSQGATRYQLDSLGHYWYTAPTGTAGNAVTFTQAMTLNSSGNLLVGTTSGAQRIRAECSSGSAALFYNNYTSGLSTAALLVGKGDNNTTTSQVFVQFLQNNAGTGSGQINANGASAAAFGSYSDSRLKENITSLPNQLANICALKPSEFDYKDGSGHQIGFIAQEMQEVYPDVVGEGEDGMLTITGWSKTEARLVKAIQELKAELDELKSTIGK